MIEGRGRTSNSTVLVLAGGLGTRLRERVPDRPKPMAEVAGRPFLSHLLDQFVCAGFRHVVICTGYLGDVIEAEFGAEYRGLELHYSRERTALGTGGALRQAMTEVATEHVVAMNGDSFCDIDLREFVAWCGEHDADAAIVAADCSDVARFGQLRLDQAARVIAFDEKGAAEGRGWINSGIYSFRSEFLRALPEATPLSLEREVLPRLVAAGFPAWRTDARFIDIGTPESFDAADSFFAAERAGLLILDRDGTVIREKHYLADPDEVELLPGVAGGLRELRELGYAVAIVTNQSGVGRGYFDEDTLAAIHGRMLDLLAEEGVQVDGIWHCPHRPDDACACRKPETGLFDAATRDLGYAAHECIVVGDKACDIDLGRRAGARTVLVRTGYGKGTESEGRCEPDAIVDGLGDVARIEVKA